MKKIVALIGIFMLMISCSTNDDQPNVHFELLPVESVVMPAEFYANTENEIKISYLQPTSCHGFDGFYYDKVDTTRTVAIQSFVLEQSNCTTLTNEIKEKSLMFKPLDPGTYLFKFWKGKDSNGEDIFEEYSIVVQ